MTFASWDVDREDVDINYGILRGLPNAGDPLRLLGAVLSVEGPPRQSRWLIDNRMVEEPLALNDLAEFVCLAKPRSEQFKDVSVALVAPEPWGLARQQVAQELPFRFRRFGDIEEARRWLLA